MTVTYECDCIAQNSLFSCFRCFFQIMKAVVVLFALLVIGAVADNALTMNSTVSGSLPTGGSVVYTLKVQRCRGIICLIDISSSKILLLFNPSSADTLSCWPEGSFGLPRPVASVLGQDDRR